MKLAKERAVGEASTGKPRRGGMGISIPRNSEAQRAGGQVIPINEVQPGDIPWKSGHVGIYIGDNQHIHAPHTGDVVKISGNAKGTFTYVRYG